MFSFFDVSVSEMVARKNIVKKEVWKREDKIKILCIHDSHIFNSSSHNMLLLPRI